MFRIDDATPSEAEQISRCVEASMAADLIDATVDLSDSDAVALALIGRKWSSRNVALHMDAAVRLARNGLDPQD